MVRRALTGTAAWMARASIDSTSPAPGPTEAAPTNTPRSVAADAEPPWVSWRLGGLEVRGHGGPALTMVVEAVDPLERVPLRGGCGGRGPLSMVAVDTDPR